jgi:hypothetical protein
MNTTTYIEDDHEKVALYFSCRNLPKKSLRNDTLLVLRKHINGNNFSIVGKTEAIKNDLNPDFTQSFELDFVFETKQKLKVEVLDLKEDGSEGPMLCEAFFELGEIAGALDNLKILTLKDFSNEPAGKCIVRMDKIDNATSYEVSFDLKISNVPKFTFFGSYNSFLKISKLRVSEASLLQTHERDGNYEDLPNNQWLTIETTPNKPGKDLLYPSFKIKGSKLCNNNFNIPIKFELWKFKDDGSHYLMGKLAVKINDLVMGRRDFNFKLQKTNNVTTLNFNNFRTEEIFGFTDFLHGGLSINLVVGIDFTASNKDPSDPKSLHYLKPKSLNLYQQAILSVGEVLEKYNHTGKIPAYGFGAKIGSPPMLSHFFPLNLNYQNPFFSNFKELFTVYEWALNQIIFSGPTQFAPMLEKVIEFAKARFELNPNNYTAFLLLTDGVINDSQATIDQIVKACHFPISIIIVGIGNEDFKNMDVLDADDVPLVSSWGETMKRDIVQFVPFNKFANNPLALREAVLEELPNQVISFAKMKGIRPNKANFVDINQLGRLPTMGTINPSMGINPNMEGNYPTLDDYMKSNIK